MRKKYYNNYKNIDKLNLMLKKEKNVVVYLAVSLIWTNSFGYKFTKADDLVNKKNITQQKHCQQNVQQNQQKIRKKYVLILNNS